jgi:hypothetical protein
MVKILCFVILDAFTKTLTVPQFETSLIFRHNMTSGSLCLPFPFTSGSRSIYGALYQIRKFPGCLFRIRIVVLTKNTLGPIQRA